MLIHTCYSWRGFLFFIFVIKFCKPFLLINCFLIFFASIREHLLRLARLVTTKKILLLIADVLCPIWTRSSKA